MKVEIKERKRNRSNIYAYLSISSFNRRNIYLATMQSNGLCFVKTGS